MKLNKLLTTLALSAGMVTAANATVATIPNWQFNANGADGIGANGSVSNVDFLVNNNTFHAVIDLNSGVGGANGFLNIGDTFNVQAYGTIESFKNTAGTVISPLGFNFNSAAGWELSFQFSINGIFTSDPTGVNLNTNFDHTSGILNFYADKLGDGSQATPNDPNPHVTDGTLIASFNIIPDGGDPTYGGVFSAALGSGADKALFTLVSNPFNAFQDSLGNPLALGTALGVSNTDFQSSVAGSPPFGYNPASFTCLHTLNDFCGTESGQFRVGFQTTPHVPEPEVLVLLGLGLGLLGLRKRFVRS